MERNEKFLTMYLLPVPVTTFVLIPFTIEKNPGCTNEAAKVLIKLSKKSIFFPFYFMFYCFSYPIITTPESYKDDLVILINHSSLHLK